MCAKCITTNKLNNDEYILQNYDVPGQVGCPHPLHEAIGLGHKHSDWSAAVRTTEIPDLACTRAVAIHILILCMEGYNTSTVSYAHTRIIPREITSGSTVLVHASSRVWAMVCCSRETVHIPTTFTVLSQGKDCVVMF